MSLIIFLSDKIPKSPLKVKAVLEKDNRPPSFTRMTSEGDHRHRKTEKEEDEELLHDIKRKESGFCFEKNPWCTF